MFTQTFSLIIRLFLFMIVGYALTKKGILPKEAARSLSILLVWVCCPALTINTLSSQITSEKLIVSLLLIILSIASLIITYLISLSFGRKLIKEKYTKNVLIYSLCVPNYGYLGSVLILFLLGQKHLADFQLFVLPVSVFVATEGYILLLDRKNSIRDLLNPLLVSTIIGLLLGVLELQIPKLIRDIFTDLSSCIGPISMILTGCVIAGYNMKQVLTKKDVYYIVCAKMLIMPIIAYAVGKLLRLPYDYFIIFVMFHCLPAGLNSVVFPSSIGKDSSIGAGVAVLSNVLAVITVPFFFNIAIG